MRFFTKLLNSALLLLVVTTAMMVAQVPADQEVIIIEGGIDNIGLLEKTINEDVDMDGNRINPFRIYQLKKDQVYIQQSRILFGSVDLGDTLSTLIIVGEEGGKKPIILMQPADGQGAWINHVHGSLTLKNLLWGVTNLSGTSNALFALHRSNQRLIMEDLITVDGFGHDLINLRDVHGTVDIYIKNCYFRDNSQLANSWNFSIFARGDNGEPIDTLWVENTTTTLAGMPYFGMGNPVNFIFFNHNTVINSPKYPLWMEQIKEGYLTNNMFINANYEGEDEGTWSTQLPDGVPSGIINIDTIKDEWWLIDPPPAMEDVKWLASNNLNFSSPFFDNYYTGGWNDVYDVPISNRAWGPIEPDMLPTPVSNIPVPLFGERTLGLIEAYDNIKVDNNYDDTVDPMMITKGIANQAVADEYIKFMRNNYGVADASETFDRSMMYFGDMDPTTIPGDDSEDASGLEDVSGFVEDFSYSSDIRSTIDQQPLGSLAWWPGKVDTYDGDAALAQIKAYFDGNVGIEEVGVDAEKLFSIYPNPSNNVLHIKSDAELHSAMFYDVTGRMVKLVNLEGDFSRQLDISDLNMGVFILQVETMSGVSDALKLVKE